MFASLTDVSLAATVLGAVLTMALGAVWYSPPVFFTTWSKLAKVNPSHMQKDGMKIMAYGFLQAIITSYLIGYVLLVASPISILEAWTWAVITWFAFTGHEIIGGMLWERHPLQLVLIKGGYSLIMVLLMTSAHFWLTV